MQSNFCLVSSIGLTLAVLSFIAPSSHAQVSLAADDVIWSVTYPDTKESFTIIRDARNVDQWYYVPNKPRLVEKDEGGTKVPVFSLVKFQYRDPQDANKLKEGGQLSFETTLGAGSAVEFLRDAVAKYKGVDKNKVRLAALPVKQATAFSCQLSPYHPYLNKSFVEADVEISPLLEPNKELGPTMRFKVKECGLGTPVQKTTYFKKRIDAKYTYRIRGVVKYGADLLRIGKAEAFTDREIVLTDDLVEVP
jgi:hypothetical protein